MESVVVMFSMVVLLLVGSAVPALSCDVSCMGDMAQTEQPTPEQLKQICTKLPSILKCLEEAVLECKDTTIKSSLESQLSGMKHHEKNCAKPTQTCDTAGFSNCQQTVPDVNGTEPTKEECDQMGKAIECLQKVECKQMEVQIAQTVETLEKKKKEHCTTDGSAFLYPSILSVALAVLLAFLGQKW